MLIVKVNINIIGTLVMLGQTTSVHLLRGCWACYVLPSETNLNFTPVSRQHFEEVSLLFSMSCVQPRLYRNGIHGSVRKLSTDLRRAPSSTPCNTSGMNWNKTVIKVLSPDIRGPTSLILSSLSRRLNGSKALQQGSKILWKVSRRSGGFKSSILMPRVLGSDVHQHSPLTHFLPCCSSALILDSI